MARRTWRVTRHEDGWQVKRDGARRATRTFSKKHDAVEAATRVARGNPPSRVIVHRPDGTVLEHADFGAPEGLSYAGVFEGPSDLGTQSEKYLAEHFSGPDADA
jgi:hypothetical protein